MFKITGIGSIAIRRGTTPTHKFHVSVPLDDVSALYITYQQNKETIIEKEIEDVIVDSAGGIIETSLSQEETLCFSSSGWDRLYPNQMRDGLVRIQIRLKYSDDRADASNVISTTVDEILKDGEI